MKLVNPSVPTDLQSTSSINSTDPTLDGELAESVTMKVYRPRTNPAEKTENIDWNVGWSEALRFAMTL
jgi:hypothetical protein